MGEYIYKLWCTVQVSVVLTRMPKYCCALGTCPRVSLMLSASLCQALF